MSENTKLWDILGRTDPSQTKPFQRPGGFRGTAVKPMWTFRRLTEQFGPCGTGWGIQDPEFKFEPAVEGEVLVFCIVRCWYMLEGEARYLIGVGGDRAVSKGRPDDEAAKKAYTDAIGNAFKFIGVAADIHMGRFDDSKYVNSMKEEFSEEKAKPQTVETQYGEVDPDWQSDGKRMSAAEAKRQKVFDEFLRELDECKSTVPLERGPPAGFFMKSWAKKARDEGFPDSMLAAMHDQIERRREEIIATMSPKDLVGIPLDEALKLSIKQSTLNAG